MEIDVPQHQVTERAQAPTRELGSFLDLLASALLLRYVDQFVGSSHRKVAIASLRLVLSFKTNKAWFGEKVSLSDRRLLRTQTHFIW